MLFRSLSRPDDAMKPPVGRLLEGGELAGKNGGAGGAAYLSDSRRRRYCANDSEAILEEKWREEEESRLSELRGSELAGSWPTS